MTWLKSHHTSPANNEPMSINDLVPAKDLQKQIDERLRAHTLKDPAYIQAMQNHEKAIKNYDIITKNISSDHDSGSERVADFSCFSPQDRDALIRFQMRLHAYKQSMNTYEIRKHLRLASHAKERLLAANVSAATSGNSSSKRDWEITANKITGIFQAIQPLMQEHQKSHSIAIMRNARPM